MNSSPSKSESPADLSRAYELLHPKVKQWIWDQNWQELRRTQALAVEPILAGELDIIISAATASGKTEAAWLPIVSALATHSDGDPGRAGVSALYVSPLKALINDQYQRLASLCELSGLKLNRRHGDVTGAERKALRTAPDGLLLITPESLEALFVLQGPKVPTLFADLRYIVIDEMHAFIGTERGAQLQSLMHRIELATRRRIPRIGLSATFADFRTATDFIRPGDGDHVQVIESATADQSDLRLQVRGYINTGDVPSPEGSGSDEAAHSLDKHSIAEHLFRNLRGTDNLIFANSRSSVEAFTDLFQQISDQERVPNEFLPHHGNLSKEFREDVEQRLKQGDLPTTAVCTSTLEMGIDIGSADSVAQIAPPHSVSALRQRIGRSGRRGKPAVLRMYISERSLDIRSNVSDRLRVGLFQATAITELMLERWYEPANSSSLHLSTLIQQILSVVAQHGGATAAQLFSALCSNGPFHAVSTSMFTQLLRDTAHAELLTQAGDGTLLPGRVGELLIDHYTFYAAFQSVDEYRLMADSRVIGTIPVDHPILLGSLIIFAGKRWRVLAIDAPSKTIQLERAGGGQAPVFLSTGAGIADGIRQRMWQLYESEQTPAYLDATAKTLLEQGRNTYDQYDLRSTRILQSGTDCLVFPWRGSRVMNTLSVLLTMEGLDASIEGLTILCRNGSTDEVLGVLATLSASPAPDPFTLAAEVPVKEVDKNDIYLGETLLSQAYAARDLDVPATLTSIEELLDATDRNT
jgi:ATP-dependent Lhr-like helicase